MPQCNAAEENVLVARARELLASYENMEEMIRLGAYRPGANAAVDEAIRHYPALERFLSQGKEEGSDLARGYAELAALLDEPERP